MVLRRPLRWPRSHRGSECRELPSRIGSHPQTEGRQKRPEHLGGTTCSGERRRSPRRRWRWLWPWDGPPATAETSAPHDLYVYGHSWTTGYGMSDPSQAYPNLVAADRGETLHNRGYNGPMVHQVADYVLGDSARHLARRDGRGRARPGGHQHRPRPRCRPSRPDHHPQRIARHGRDRLGVATHRGHRPQPRYHGTWRTQRLSGASGGAMHVTTRNNSFVQFRAVGGEYLVLRGVSGTGITVRLSDRTAGHTVTRIRTGRRVHPSYGRSGIALLYRVPSRMAGHTIRLTKESGSGSFMFDARLPQKRHPDEVVLLKEPYLLDYSISTAHPNGDDHVMDVFNAVLDQVDAEIFRHGRGRSQQPRVGQADHVVPPLDPSQRARSRFLADLVHQALRSAQAG